MKPISAKFTNVHMEITRNNKGFCLKIRSILLLVNQQTPVNFDQQYLKNELTNLNVF